MKRTRHIEPDGGYGFGNKAKYRREKWAFVNAALTNIVPIRKRRVLLLETEEFNEVECLLARGYSPMNIHIVNKAWVSGADRAWATRKCEARFGCRVSIHGCEMTDAIQETSEQQIDVYDFDGTSTVEGAQSVLNLTAECAGTRRHVTTVTVFGGRERSEFWRTLLGTLSPQKFIATDHRGRMRVQAMTEGHVARIHALFMSMSQASEDPDASCTSHISKVRVGRYLSSSGRPMLWCAALLHAHDPNDLKQEMSQMVPGAAEFLYTLVGSDLAPWCVWKPAVEWAAANPQLAEEMARVTKCGIAERLAAGL